MADLVDLHGAKIIREEVHKDETQSAIEELLADLRSSNGARRISSIIVVMLGYKGDTNVLAVSTDSAATMIGAIEIAKHSLVPRRGWTDFETPEGDDA